MNAISTYFEREPDYLELGNNIKNILTIIY